MVIALDTSYEQTIKVEYHLGSVDFASFVSFVTAFWGKRFGAHIVDQLFRGEIWCSYCGRSLDLLFVLQYCLRGKAADFNSGSVGE